MLDISPALSSGVFVHVHDAHFSYDFRRVVLSDELFFGTRASCCMRFSYATAPRSAYAADGEWACPRPEHYRRHPVRYLHSDHGLSLKLHLRVGAESSASRLCLVVRSQVNSAA